AILGGTFDPVHNGHLRMAVELRDMLQAAVHLVPSACPVHRATPGASAQERLAMLRLAVGNEPGLVVDDREIRRGGASYMFDTLAELRQEVGQETPLVLVLGCDAFNGLASWYRWLEIPDLAHIMILERPGWVISEQTELRELLTKRQVSTISELYRQPSGLILPVVLSRLDISSSYIRSCIERGRSPRFLLPDPVLDFIRTHQLYVRRAVQQRPSPTFPSSGGA